jgi:hypothetical protein
MKTMQSRLDPMPTYFGHVLGKLTFSGVRSRQVKCGKLVVNFYFFEVLCSEINWVILSAESILKSISDHVQAAVGPYQDSPLGLPDPSFLLQLPDNVYTGSNLYAIQKIFDGPFQFDVYFDSGSVKQKLTCKGTFLRTF